MKDFITCLGILCTYQGTEEVVIVPEGLDTIKEGAFSGNPHIRTVILPEGVRKLEDYCFRNCENLEEVLFPSSVEEVGCAAFSGCSRLKSVTLPEKLKIVSTEMFTGCRKLQEVIMPAGLEIIERGAFEDCYNLEKIQIPPSVQKIESYVFGLGVGAGINKLIKLERNQGLKAIELPESLQSIPVRAFIGQSNLEKIIWPKMLKQIEVEAFRGCTNLKIKSLPESLTYIAKNALQDCQVDSDCNIPEKCIAGSELYPWARQEEVIIPDYMTTIPDSFFKGDQQIRKVDLSSIRSISRQAFFGCDNLETVVVSDRLQQIDDMAFMNCTALKSIHLPDSIRGDGLGASVFSGCISLQSVYLPNSLRILWPRTFAGCTSLKKVIFASSEEGKQISLKIKDSVFSGCSGLTSIDLPDRCCYLGHRCFEDCISLKKLEIPSGVKSTGEFLVNNCSSLQSIRYSSHLDEGMLEGAPSSLTLITPNTDFLQIKKPHTKRILCRGYAIQKQEGREISQGQEEAILSYIKSRRSDFLSELPNNDALLRVMVINRLLTKSQASSLLYSVNQDMQNLIGEQYPALLKIKKKEMNLEELKNKLFAAVAQNNLDELQEMVQHYNIPKEATIRNSETLLEFALKEKNLEAIQYIASKIPVPEPERVMNLAIQQHWIEAIQAILSSKAVLTKGKKSGFKPPLTTAVESGNMEIMQLLFTKRFSLPIPLLKSSFQLAMKNGNREIARFLLQKMKNIKEEDYLQLMETAIAYEDLPSMETLLNCTEEVIINRDSSSGFLRECEWQGISLLDSVILSSKLPWIQAVETGNTNMVKLMFEKGMTIPDDMTAYCCFRTSCQCHYPEMTKLLISKRVMIPDETFNRLVEDAIVYEDRQSLEAFLNWEGHKILEGSLVLAYALRKGDLNLFVRLGRRVRLHDAREYLQLPYSKLLADRIDSRYDQIDQTYHSVNADDDYKAIFNRVNEGKDQSGPYAFDEMFEGRNNRFGKNYASIPRMSEDRISEFLCRMEEEKVCSKEDMKYFWFLAVLADLIQVAEKLEERGHACKDLSKLAERAGITRKLEVFSDLAVPGMSLKKAEYVLDHMEQGETITIGKKYFSGSQYSLNVFMKLITTGKKEQFHIPDAKTALESIIQFGNLPCVDMLSSFGAITSKNIGNFINIADRENHTELRMWLLNYQNEHFQPRSGGLSL